MEGETRDFYIGERSKENKSCRFYLKLELTMHSTRILTSCTFIEKFPPPSIFLDQDSGDIR